MKLLTARLHSSDLLIYDWNRHQDQSVWCHWWSWNAWHCWGCSKIDLSIRTPSNKSPELRVFPLWDNYIFWPAFCQFAVVDAVVIVVHIVLEKCKKKVEFFRLIGFRIFPQKVTHFWGRYFSTKCLLSRVGIQVRNMKMVFNISALGVW